MKSHNRALLVASVAVHALVWWIGVRSVALDPDAMNLAYGMRHFDITHFNPHAPGYLIYVWVLRAVHALTGSGDALAERFATVQLVSLLFGLAAIATVYAAARRTELAGTVPGWAAVIVAVHPILVFHSIDGQTHTSEAFASALLLFTALGYRSRPKWTRAVAMGLALAFGAALRPSFVIFGIPVVVWTIGARNLVELVVAGTTSIFGALAWLLPTFAASGGWETWRAATHGLVQNGFVRTSSPLSDQAVGALVSANQLSLAVWSAEALAPLFVALLVIALSTGSIARLFAPGTTSRWLAGALILGGGFSVSFYAATFVSEPGYLATLLPPVALLVGATTTDAHGSRSAGFALLTTLALWAVPLLPHVLKVPSVAEWRRRSDLAAAYAEHVDRALPGEGPYLAVIGHPDITVGRQLPMLDARIDVLLVHDGRRPWIANSSLTYVTEDDSVPIPEAFGPPGAGSSLEASRYYAGVFFDGSLPLHFQTQIAQRSRCSFEAARGVEETVVLPVQCIRDGSLLLDGLELRLIFR